VSIADVQQGIGSYLLLVTTRLLVGVGQLFSEFIDAIKLRYECERNRCYNKKQIGEGVKDIPVAECKIAVQIEWKPCVD